MDDYFRKLYTVSSRKELTEAFKESVLLMRHINEVDRLDFAYRLLGWLEDYGASHFNEMVMKEVIELAKETDTEEAALLLGYKASFDYANNDSPATTDFSDLALKKSRDIGSNNAEVNSLIVKGCMCDAQKEHKKARVWFTMALAKCTKIQRPDLMREIGISLRDQGEYSQAWSFLNKAKSLSSDLLDDESLDDIERTECNLNIARAYLELGQVHKAIGDFDGALRAYDKGLSLSMQYNFTKEIQQIYSQKAQAYFMIGNESEGMATLTKVKELLNESFIIDQNVLFDYILYSVRVLKNTKHYEEALEMYREILFEGAIDAQTGFKRLNDLMNNHTNTFLEIVKGIEVCLHAIGCITESEIISKEEALFSELAQQTGNVNEDDRNYKLRIQKNSLRVALERIFFPRPDFVEYKNIQAKYDPTEEKVTFKIDKKEIKRARRYFLVFKCLVNNAGERVTGKMLDDFVFNQGEAIAKGNSGLRTYVDRLKKQINLVQFLEPYSRSSKGWKLKAP